MRMEHHIRRGHPITFGLITLFGLFELALTAWLTTRFAGQHDERNRTERDRVHFALFASTWTVALSTLMMLLFWHSPDGSKLTSVLAHLVFLGLTWIIWAAAAAAITVTLGGGLNCETQDVFVYCNQLNALEGFAWIEWLLVTFAIIVVFVRAIASSRRGDGLQGSLI
ncbi:hypothetical protein C8J57DRAFT_1275212 [Mycena rebaudengoi]|nr:hypothetical protein C8J57DRAFT_1275212 [Mycena rebaudengoi]